MFGVLIENVIKKKCRVSLGKTYPCGKRKYFKRDGRDRYRIVSNDEQFNRSKISKIALVIFKISVWRRQS